MIIRPDSVKIENMYNSMKKTAKKSSGMFVPVFACIMVCFPFIIAIITQFLENSRSMDFDDLLPLISIFLVIGIVGGLIFKAFMHNAILKENVAFVSQVKNTGIKIENDLISGRMLKVDENSPATRIAKVQEVLPKKAFDVAFKISNVTNVEISEKILANINYGKFCTITLGIEKYYLVCLNDADALELRNTILNYKA